MARKPVTSPTPEKSEGRLPSAVDAHVGARMRARRKSMGMSQERLADRLGLTFQQVQKYERGSNRVSASKLFEVARTLQAPIPYFYEGLPDFDMTTYGVAEGEAAPFVHDVGPPLSPEADEAGRLFARIPAVKTRRRLLELLRALADG